ncbi:MAG: nitrous oxide reductase accessory protein NosL [Saprospiraceae bacterium]|nr:nitrous oxide reductase accessory protein NosL [Saprospiraceae bacterium]
MSLSNTTRILIAIGSALLVIAFFVPLWQIMLWAPQYPEGLTMRIWHNDLSGDVAIINGLNHYIGMKHISVEMFPEFKIIGLLIGVLILVGLAAALFKSPRILFFFTLLSYVYGFAALYDFYSWGYDYGHNLDQNAAIKVPDMSYQPPVLGYKNLLNFTAYSGPDTGAWVIIGVCLMATVLWWWEFFKARKKSGSKTKTGALAALLPMLMLWSCSTEPVPINFGKDECAHCKMTLMDKRFGAEIISNKGKAFKFDDLNCLVGYIKEGSIQQQDIGGTYVVDFKKTGGFVSVDKAFFLENQTIKSPMRSDIAGFSSAADRDALKAQIGGGKELTWQEVMNLF